MIQSDGLSDRFGAMTVKELRQGLRRGMFVFPFILIQFLAVLAMAFEFTIGDVEPSSQYTGVLNPALYFDSGPFWLVATLVCVLVMPLGGLALMGQELDEGNHELLLMTPLTRWRVVCGKFLALWGLCLVTFVSLMPYLIVRYFIGGIDAWRNIILVVSVVLASGIFCAAFIGASAFRSLAGRLAISALFLISLLFSGMPALMASAFRTDGCGVVYHLNAFSLFICYTLFGLALARSRIRLVLHHYEVRPGWMMIGLLLFSPLVVGMATAMTLGYGGFVGLLGMGLVAWFADMTPKAPKWMPVPMENVPVPGGLADAAPAAGAPTAASLQASAALGLSHSPEKPDGGETQGKAE